MGYTILWHAEREFNGYLLILPLTLDAGSQSRSPKRIGC